MYPTTSAHHSSMSQHNPITIHYITIFLSYCHHIVTILSSYYYQISTILLHITVYYLWFMVDLPKLSHCVVFFDCLRQADDPTPLMESKMTEEAPEMNDDDDDCGDGDDDDLFHY